VTCDGRFAYTGNAGSANVSQYTIASNGPVSLVGTGASGATTAGAVDLDVTDGDGFLYVLGSRAGAISAFSIDPCNGSLTPIAGTIGRFSSESATICPASAPRRTGKRPELLRPIGYKRRW
jgi:6-phosphogluconolactonase (cycloisomerase 2 family)